MLTLQRTTSLLAAWLAVQGSASASGAYLPASGTAESTRQRAVLVLEGNITTLLVQSDFTGTASDIAWIVPVTADAQQIGLGTSDAFARLHQETTPLLARVVEKRKRFGCSTEGRTFSTPTTQPAFAGVGVAGTAFFPLDSAVSAKVFDWLDARGLGLICPDRATACAVDEDCGAATVCRDGLCSNQVFACANDMDCGADLECFEQICVNLTPSCADDTDCRGEISCRDGGCLHLTPTCADDADCGGVIEPGTGRCQGVCNDVDATPCTDDTDCPNPGEVCERTCSDASPSAYEGNACTSDQDCGPQECRRTCGSGRNCSNDTDCGGLNECRSGECFFDDPPKRSCARDEDCVGAIACVDGVCEHGGWVCDSDDDCGGVTECTRHCTNRVVSCSNDSECDMVCRQSRCQDPVGASDPRSTDVPCDEDLDCSAREECNTVTVNGGDLSLCTNLAPPCSSGVECDTTCVEFPVGSGQRTCGGSFSEIECTGDGPCQASVECRRGICENTTRACASEPECNTTCEVPRPERGDYGLGVLCTTDDDCASGRCVARGEVSACSEVCTRSEDCPSSTDDFVNGFDCVAATGEGFCWPRQVEPVPPGRCLSDDSPTDVRCALNEDCAARTECRSRTSGQSPFPQSADQTAWLQSYIDDGARFAVAVLSGAAPASGDDALEPLSIQIGGNEPALPLRTVAGAAVDLEIYVIASERYRPEGYPSREVVIDRLFDGGSFDDWYQERLEQNFADMTEPGFLVEYADIVDLELVDHVLGRPANIAQLGAESWFLTKLRARLTAPPEDLRLVATGDSRRYVIRAVGTGTAGEASFGGFGALCAAGWGLWRARRRRR